MTPRERIEAALNHQEADRVPIDFGGTRITGISAVAYKKLLQYLGRVEEIKLYDIKQQLAEPSIEMTRFIGGDVVHLTRLGPTTGMPFLHIDKWKDGTMVDGSPCLVPEEYDPVFIDDGSMEIRRDGEVLARRPESGLYVDVITTPLKDAESPEDIDAYTWPNPWTEGEEKFISSEIERLYHGTDLAVFAGLPVFDCSFFEIGQYLFGFENLLMNFFLKRDMMEYWLDKVLDHHLDILDKFLNIAGSYISAIQMNDDFGSQDNLLIPPDLYRELIKPRQRKWIEFVKERSNATIFFHCDGAVADILDDFIEIGIEILNPLQTGAKGMEPEALKRRYGKNLSFWGGGIDTQKTLPFGSIDEIKQEVRERIRMLGRGGGYVFATIHNIQPDITPEKVMAVFETAMENAKYPLD